MRNSLGQDIRATIDVAILPLLELFASSVATMRENGAKNDEIEDVIDRAIETFPGLMNPEAVAYVVSQMRAVVGLGPTVAAS
jgi:hypothetical protein